MLLERYNRRYNRKSFWFDDSKRWSLTVMGAPATEPVTILDAMDNARIDEDRDARWVGTAITAARELCEVFSKRCFITTTLKLNLEQFPPYEFVLPRPNLISVTSVKYLDLNNVQQTLASSAYTVDTNAVPGRIVPTYNTSWPDHLFYTNSIEVVYVAGYGAAGAVPQSIKQAIKFTVADWYGNRDSQGQLPPIAKALLKSEAWGFVP